MAVASVSALGNRNFIIYSAGAVFSTNGIWIQRLTLGWMAWDSTHSEFWVGTVAFLLFAPIILLGPVFGVLADRGDRRRAAILTMSGILLTTAAFTTATALFEVGIAAVCVVATLFGIANSAYHPIRLSLVPMLVERAQLRSAVATTAIIFNVSRLVGPALAGVLITVGGVTSAFAVNALLYVPMLFALRAVQMRERDGQAEVRRAVFFELRSGIAHAWSSSVIMPFMLLAAINSVCGRGLLELLPAFADGVFQRGSAGLAMLTSSAGAGAIVAGLIMSRTAVSMRSTGRGGALAAGLVCVMLGLNGSFVVAVVLVTVLGFTITLVGVSSQAAIQTHVDDTYRGRVMSLWGVVGFGGTALGGLTIGAVSETLGLPLASVLWGVVCTGAVLAVMFLVRADHA